MAARLGRGDAPGIDLVSADPNTERNRLTDGPASGGQNLQEDPHPVLPAAAVRVIPLVGVRRHELSDEIPVRSVDLDAVDAGLGHASGGRTEAVDDLVDLRLGDGERRLRQLAMGDARRRDRRGRPRRVTAGSHEGAAGVHQLLEQPHRVFPKVPQRPAVFRHLQIVLESKATLRGRVNRGRLDDRQADTAPRRGRVVGHEVAAGVVAQRQPGCMSRPYDPVRYLDRADGDRLQNVFVTRRHVPSSAREIFAPGRHPIMYAAMSMVSSGPAERQRVGPTTVADHHAHPRRRLRSDRRQPVLRPAAPGSDLAQPARQLRCRHHGGHGDPDRLCHRSGLRAAAGRPAREPGARVPHADGGRDRARRPGLRPQLWRVRGCGGHRRTDVGRRSDPRAVRRKPGSARAARTFRGQGHERVADRHVARAHRREPRRGRGYAGERSMSCPRSRWSARRWRSGGSFLG